jgi:hypothetical protein
MAGKQTSSPSSPHKSFASPPPPSSSPSVVIDDGVNKSLSRIDDGVVAVLVVRRIDGVVVVLVVRQIDGVVVKNDKTDPDGPDDPDGNAAAAAVDCAARGVQLQSWLLEMSQTWAREED